MPFKPGDFVRKKENEGFVGEALRCFIPDLTENKNRPPCMSCGKDDCLEWPTLWVMDSQDRLLGSVYHVGDCGLELLKPGPTSTVVTISKS